MIKISVFSLFVLSFLIGCKNNKGENGKIQKPAGTKLSLEYKIPEGWIVTHATSPIIINENLKANKDDFNETIIIHTIKLDTSKTLLQVAKQLKLDSEFQDEGLMQQYFGEDTINGIALYRYSYNSILNNASNDIAVVNNYVFQKGIQAYILSTRCLKKNNEYYQKIFIQFLNQFHT